MGWVALVGDTAYAIWLTMIDIGCTLSHRTRYGFLHLRHDRCKHSWFSVVASRSDDECSGASVGVDDKRGSHLRACTGRGALLTRIDFDSTW